MRFHWLDIDPPWHYETYSDKGNGIAGKHYSVMTDEDILSLPINDLMEADSLCSLWATWPLLPIALECGKRWQLEYITCLFLQIKRYVGKDSQNSWFLGNGHYSRANTEPCLLFKKGDGLGLPSDRGIKQVVGDLPLDFGMDQLFPELLIARYEKHSKKPADCYAGIERMYPNASRIRLFARDHRPGWVSIGLEITGNDIRDDMERIINEPERTPNPA